MTFKSFAWNFIFVYLFVQAELCFNKGLVYENQKNNDETFAERTRTFHFRQNIYIEKCWAKHSGLMSVKHKIVFTLQCISMTIFHLRGHS